MVERKAGPVERWIAQVVVDGRKRRVTALTEAAAKKELRRLLEAGGSVETCKTGKPGEPTRSERPTAADQPRRWQ